MDQASDSSASATAAGCQQGAKFIGLNLNLDGRLTWSYCKMIRPERQGKGGWYPTDGEQPAARCCLLSSHAYSLVRLLLRVSAL